MRILSWNVNGIRAALESGFLEWLAKESPDILCLQETKAYPDQLDPSIVSPRGYVDTFRHFNKEGGQYTYWDYKTRARERNVGWRIDYFFATEKFLPKVKDAFILPEVQDSDHCPTGIEIK
jgi:exonuclease III